MASKLSVREETGIVVRGQLLDGSECPAKAFGAHPGADGGHGRSLSREVI